MFLNSLNNSQKSLFIELAIKAAESNGIVPIEEKNMLKGISPLISPELLKVLCEMGHGDEIVLADANFPSETTGKRVIRADGIGAADLLKAILPLFPLDTYEKDRFILMEVVPGDPVVPVIWDEYKKILNEPVETGCVQ